MAGNRATNGYLSRFLVADLTDNHYIRVLPHESSGGRGKRVPGFLIDLGLTDKIQTVFDRIFNSDDIFIQKVDLSETGIQRRCLATAGWSGYEQDPVRLVEQLPHGVYHTFIK